MSLRERIEKQVADGLGAIEEQKRADQKFDDAWHALKIGVVHKVLTEAGKAIEATKLGGAHVDHTDYGVALMVGIPKRDAGGYHENKLALASDRKALRVVCSTLPPNLLDKVVEREGFASLELDEIDEEMLEKLSEAFVEGILDGVASRARSRR